MVSVVSGQGGRLQSVCFPWHYYGVFLPGFLEPVILICLVHSPYLGFLRILPHVLTHPLAEMGPTAEATGWSIRFHCSPPGPQGAFSVHVRWPRQGEGRSSWLWEWELRGLRRPSLFPWLSCSSRPGVWVSREWISNCFTLRGPICLLPALSMVSVPPA